MASTKKAHSTSRALGLPDVDGRAVLDSLVVSGLLLLLAGCAAYVLLVVLGVLDGGVRLPSGQSVNALLGLAGPGGEEQRMLVGGVALMAGLFTSGIFLARLGGSAPREESRGATHVLSADEHGLVVMDNRGLCNVAIAAVRAIPGVVQVRVKVRGSGASPVKLNLEVWASAAAEQHTVGEQARVRATDAIQRLVGLQVQQVAVRMKAVPLEDLGRMLQ